MSTISEDGPDVHHVAVDEAQQIEAREPLGASGDPTMLGLPTFILGSIALGLALTGYLPAAAAAATLPIIIISTGLGQFVAALWAIKLGQSAVACIFGVFSGFWLSYALLLLGLGHGWYGIKTGDVQATVSAFLLTWCIGVGALTGVTLRLPLAFTVLFALVDLALALVLLGNKRTSTALTHAGGYVVLLFAALGVYLFAGAASAATGASRSGWASRSSADAPPPGTGALPASGEVLAAHPALYEQLRHLLAQGYA